MEQAELKKILTKQLTNRFSVECTRNKARFSDHHTLDEQKQVQILVDDFLRDLGTYFPEFFLLNEGAQILAVNTIRLAVR
jgi:hypothetical protein